MGDRELEEIYAYPPDLSRPWVQVNFVASTDGAATVAGRSAGLSSPADKKIFTLGRDLADVVLVGAGTALVEGYRGIKRTERRTERRARLGLSETPPVAIVTGRCSVLPDSPLVTDTRVPPIVLTCRRAPADRRAALVDAGVDVVLAGEDTVDLRRAIDAMNERGLRRVCCEGGPTVFGGLVAAGLVDQLCLTVAPLLAAGDAPRIATGAGGAPVGMRLASALRAGDYLMLRYRKE